MIEQSDSGPAPRLSVVMPSFQQGRFIETAVRSVLEQPESGVELVVADGGSTDETLSRLAALSAQFPGRLRWTSQLDAGPASAVNRAVAASRGPLLGWLNSDDLYQPGAIGRALAHFERHPEDVMVYGEGWHIDESGAVLERYPTQKPETPTEAFADGCFICQPTAFFRRDAFEDAGRLDETLRASFDFELWLRLFRRYPGRIGFISDFQASTRLHGDTITSGQRARVALEGVQVVARHLGHAPGHWIKTYFSEAAAQHPFYAAPGQSLQKICSEMIRKAAPYLAPGEEADLESTLLQHRAIALSTPWFQATVHSDGWAGPQLSLKLVQTATPVAVIEVHGRAVSQATPLQLTVSAPGEADYRVLVEERGSFDVMIEVAERRPGAWVVVRIASDPVFVPADTEFESGDGRSLCFVVEGIDLHYARSRRL